MSRRPEVPRATSRTSTLVAAVVLIAVAAATVMMVTNWDDWTSTLQDEVTKIPTLQAAEQQQQVASSESLLFLVADDTGRIASIVLVAVADDHPASLSVIPANLFELLPGYGEFALAEASRFEGPELARVAISNALGARIDRVRLVPAGQLAAAVTTPLELVLSEPVVLSNPEHLADIFDTGPGIYDGTLVERLLVDRGESSQIGWLERQAAVWQGLLNMSALDARAAFRLLGDAPSAAIFATAAARGNPVSLIPVTPVAVAGGEDGFQLQQADVAAFVADRLAHLALATEVRPRVEVLNGNGAILATRSVVEALVAAGFHVVKTDNADNFDFAETVVIAQGRANRDAAEDAAGILGVRMVQLELAAPSGVVDVSIIVGQDIATLRS